MVSADDKEGGEERRIKKEYSLDKIKELASMANTVVYASTRVEYDVDNLGYSLKDVHKCLASLEERHYKESILYENQRHWLDVYHIEFPGPTGHIDKLYIKLKLNRDCIMIVLQSFHGPRSL